MTSTKKSGAQFEWTYHDTKTLIYVWRKFNLPLDGRSCVDSSSNGYKNVTEYLHRIGVNKTCEQVVAKIKKLRSGYRAVRNGKWHINSIKSSLKYLPLLDDFLSPTPFTAAELQAIYARFPRHVPKSSSEAVENDNYDEIALGCYETEVETSTSPIKANGRSEMYQPYAHHLGIGSSEEDIQASENLRLLLESANLRNKVTVLPLYDPPVSTSETFTENENGAGKEALPSDIDHSVPVPSLSSPSTSNCKILTETASQVPAPVLSPPHGSNNVIGPVATSQSVRKPWPSYESGTITLSLVSPHKVSRKLTFPETEYQPKETLRSQNIKSKLIIADSVKTFFSKQNGLKHKTTIKRNAELKKQNPSSSSESIQSLHNSSTKEKTLEKKKLCFESEKSCLYLEEQGLQISKLKMESELLAAKLENEKTMFERASWLLNIKVGREKRKTKLLQQSDEVIETVLKKMKYNVE